MTIQISVTIWTVICFILLMLILHNLLFKPLLKVMDNRQSRIEKAGLKKSELERLKAQQIALEEEKKQEFLLNEKKRVREEIEAIRTECKVAVETAQDNRIRQVDDYRIKAEEEQTEILNTLGVHTNELAVAFAESLLKE